MELGPLIFDIKGTQLTKEDKEILQHPLVGGVIFFAHNYESPEQISALCQAIRATRPGAIIMVDQEGGRVQRFKDGLTKLPSLRLLGRLWDAHPDKHETILKFSYQLGALMAVEVLSLGVDLSLAPVVDLDKQLNEVIGERAFHSTPNEIIQLAASYIEGMGHAGMGSTIKHFPGHGSVTLDSHVDLPIDDREQTEIAEDMLPFKQLVKEANTKAVMPAHVIYKQLDSRPACFSRYWLTEILRGSLGFKGAIISDDLTMQAAHVMGDYLSRAQEALQAGCDIVLVCNHRQGVTDILDTLQYQISDESVYRINQLRMQKQHTFDALSKNSIWQESKKGLKKFEGLCACLNPSLV